MVFEVLIVQHPSKKEIEDGNTLEKILLGPVTVVASDVQAAAIAVVMDHPSELQGVDRGRMQVFARPFA